ncbi:MAG TPA: HAD family hydrolase [Candidatus Limnocylindria bacterium]|jgi:FMN phosphatase YigB (HAD superfamily)|nr:HAD family hydrolase [Candidatus Limnocylindria bacterium]
MALVFLFDVDNTLLDNDRAKGDLERAIRDLVGRDRAARFWSLYEEVRREMGVVDYPETLRRFRRAYRDEPPVADVDRAVLDLPYDRYLYPGALDVIARLWTRGEPAIFSDGDRVYQPMKIARAGLFNAVRGNVLVYEHKEGRLAEVQIRFPAEQYAHIDDKAALLARTKAGLGARVTTVHVRQGHYAAEEADPPPDIAVDCIADLLMLDVARLGA